MARQRFDLDRSCAFTILLDVDPSFPEMEWPAYGQRVTAFLADWYQSDSTVMYQFCRAWITGGH